MSNRKRNDATLSKLGDIYQYYIALLDCFKMEAGDKIQIEINGDVTLISSQTKKSFQKEVKHHTGSYELTDRDPDLWNTLRNWLLDHKDNLQFNQLVLFSTADIPKTSVFYDWNSKETDEKYNILFNIGTEVRKREKAFRPCYNDIFSNALLAKNQICKVLNKFTIEHLQPQIQGIATRFTPYLITIPAENRDNYIAALLGIALKQVVAPPHIWEVSFEIFQQQAQAIAPSYMQPGKVSLPLDYSEYELSEDECVVANEKKFVKALESIEYKKIVPFAIADYWKATKTIVRYFRDNISYTTSFKPYRTSLNKRMFYAKESVLNGEPLVNRSQELSASRRLCSEILGWEAKDFGSVVANQQFFQNGIIHDIVNEREFFWDVRDDHES